MVKPTEKNGLMWSSGILKWVFQAYIERADISVILPSFLIKIKISVQMLIIKT